MIFTMVVVSIVYRSPSACAVHLISMSHDSVKPAYQDDGHNFTVHPRHSPTRQRVVRPGTAVQPSWRTKEDRVQLSTGSSVVTIGSSPYRDTGRATSDRTRRRRKYPDALGSSRRRLSAGRRSGRDRTEWGTPPAASGELQWNVARLKRSPEATNRFREFVLHSLNEVRRNVHPRAANMLFTVRNLE